MILDKIIESTKIRVKKAKKEISLEKMISMAKKSENPFAFENELRKNADKSSILDVINENAVLPGNSRNETAIQQGNFENGSDIQPVNFKNETDIQSLELKNRNDISFICEVKKASPSKGVLVEDFPYVKIAKEYEEAGASAISVLTEPEFFMGSIEYLKQIKENVKIPVLQKDFIIDEYQIYETSVIHADAILLICAVLNVETMKKFIKIADSLGLSCLVEAHDEKEIQMALDAGARVIGVNNRNLNTFEVDISNSIQLRNLVPKSIVFVSESGIKTANDIDALREIAVDAVLVGEALIKSGNIKDALSKLSGDKKRAAEKHASTKIKICGIKSFKDIEYVNEALPDYIGFVFAKSKRHVDFSKAYLLKSELNKQIKVVGVFVNEDIDFIKKCCDRGVIDIVQLHGDEDEKYIRQLKKTVYKPIIKAIRIKKDTTLPMEENETLQSISKIVKLVNYPLFDTYQKDDYGGTGQTFPWKCIQGYDKPFVLAGGLNSSNIEEAILSTNPYCVDISSGVETNGIKDKQKIIEIVKLVRGIK